MTKIILVLFLFSMVIMSGCVSTAEETPSDVVKQFFDLQTMNKDQECYDLMSEDYQNEHDLDAFMDQLKINGKTSANYRLFKVVNETEVIAGEHSIVRIHVIEQSNLSAFHESELNGSGLGQDLLETREIELFKEQTGWKLKSVYPELVINKANYSVFYFN
ncbi:hypothetical protein [Methanococcoides sp. NM1]|uniref:hypothetical protein n=1 Tax=Methanococcoides sp. NM1 TaxID=1201013 RepID=UPI0010833E6A|nr:hypothetical protein [Methanococcoides sp. NM1]